MRSKVAQRILNRTSKDVEIYVRWYGDIVVLINQIMKEKGYTKRELAKKLGKSPSEITKWLKGEHNFTLRSLAKLQAILDEPIIHIPKKNTFQTACSKSFSMTVYKNTLKTMDKNFEEATISKKTIKTAVA